MGTKLYVYTGTGNSLWIARQLALELKDATVQFIPNLSSDFKVEADWVGIIFPVHIWGLPSRVIQFINHLQVKPETYLFALAVNADQPAATLLQLQKLMSTRGRSLALGSSFVMPSNYTPWGGPGPIDAQQRLFSKAQEKVKAIAGTILRGERKRWTEDLFGRTSPSPGSIRCLFDLFGRWTRNSGWMINVIAVESAPRFVRPAISR